MHLSCRHHVSCQIAHSIICLAVNTASCAFPSPHQNDIASVLRAQKYFNFVRLSKHSSRSHRGIELLQLQNVEFIYVALQQNFLSELDSSCLEFFNRASYVLIHRSAVSAFELIHTSIHKLHNGDGNGQQTSPHNNYSSGLSFLEEEGKDLDICQP